MKKLIILFLFISSFNLSAKTINVLEAGGFADGVTSNTLVIKNAIDALSKIGGGTLQFSAGIYVTGPIVMKSNITLDIQSGAVIKFSDDFSEYTPFVEMRYEGAVMKSFCPMIYAYEQENITIKGNGTIDGNGQKWWYGTFTLEGAHKDEDFLKELLVYKEMWKKENPDFTIEKQSDWKRTLNKGFFRPPLMQPYKCKNVRIEGVNIINSPFWTINPEFCEDVYITGVKINNPDAPNTDGINPSSCKNVIISDCNIHVGDDCITLKSGRDLQGREYATPCENITITNCIMLAGHGGVVIGSEMSGDVRNVTISNCVFDGTDRGIRIKSARGRGGIVENIRIDNIMMRNIQKEAITYNLFYADVPAEPFTDRTPIFRNIHVSNLTGVNVNIACTVLGIEESFIKNLSFSNINIDAQTGFTFSKVNDVLLRDVKVGTQVGAAFKISDASNIYIDNVAGTNPITSEAVIDLHNAKDVVIEGCFPLGGSKSFINMTGSQTSNVLMGHNYFNRLLTPINKSKEVKAEI